MKILIIAAMLAATGPALGEELVGGRLVFELLKEGVKQQLMGRPAPAGCEVLRWNRQSSNTPYLPIRKPGNYCLDQDYEMDCSMFSHGCAGQLIDVRANDVDIDFRGHTLRVRGTRAYGGVWGLGRNIRVHNGTIVGAGSGVQLVQSTPVTGPAGFVVESMRFIDVREPLDLAGEGNTVRGNETAAAPD